MGAERGKVVCGGSNCLCPLQAVRQVLASYRVSAASKNVKLRGNVRANVPRAVVGDRHRFD